MSAIAKRFFEIPARNAGLERVGVVIPTYNAAPYWQALQAALDQQGLTGKQILIIDSSSSDDTSALARRAGYEVVQIAKTDFRHGATRQAACDYLPSAQLLLFMTQDALPEGPDALRTLCSALDDETVGAAYGRQLPRRNADPIERHGRLFNYPPVREVRTIESRYRLGIKAAFFSNSFAVYRRSALEQVGGFPKETIVSEEVTVAARMLMAGWKIAYQADAMAAHSHPLTLQEEFSRYFDIGVHHGRERWLMETFGTADGEGLKYVKDEMRYLWSNAPLWLPYAILRTFSKYVGYHLGKRERKLPRPLKRLISAHPQFWSE